MDAPAPVDHPGDEPPDPEKQLEAIRERKAGETKADPPKATVAAIKAFEREAWQIVVLRYLVFFGMYGLLCAEIFAVIWVIDKQGRGIYHLADWLIGLLITVIFFQTVWVLQVIATDLFPKGIEKSGQHPGLRPGTASK